MRGNIIKSNTYFMKYILGAIVVVGIVWGTLSFSEKQLEQLESAVALYETCIEEQTGMSPALFYQHHNYYPECY